VPSAEDSGLEDDEERREKRDCNSLSWEVLLVGG